MVPRAPHSMGQPVSQTLKPIISLSMMPLQVGGTAGPTSKQSLEPQRQGAKWNGSDTTPSASSVWASVWPLLGHRSDKPKAKVACPHSWQAGVPGGLVPGVDGGNRHQLAALPLTLLPPWAGPSGFSVLETPPPCPPTAASPGWHTKQTRQESSGLPRALLSE